MNGKLRMAQEIDEYIGDEASGRPRHALMTWPALVAIGWLIYEATAQPNLGAAIVCAKFGWAGAATGLP